MSNTEVTTEAKQEYQETQVDQNPLELLNTAIKIKDQANIYFRNQQYYEAVQLYHKAFETFKPGEQCPEAIKQEYNKLKLAIMTNLALCFLKINRPSEAKLQCEEGLKVFPNNLKLTNYLGFALADLQEYEAALRKLKHVQRYMPENKALEEKIKEVTAALDKYKEEMRRSFGGVLNKSTEKKEDNSLNYWKWVLTGAAFSLGVGLLLSKTLKHKHT